MRFPDFNDDWKETTLGEVAEIKKGSGLSKEDLTESGQPVILYGELYTTYTKEVIDTIYSKTNVNSEKLVVTNGGEVIIPSSGETAWDIATARCVIPSNVILGGDLNIITLKKDNGAFFSYFLNGVRKRAIAEIAQGSSVVHLYGKDIIKLSVSLPSLAEQKKIADFLSLIDERIHSLSETIAQMKSLRDGFYNTISHRRKQEWQSSFLRDILTERKENNAMLHEVYSVSVSRGIVNQIEHLGRSFASKDTSHYNTVHFGDIVYTKSPTGKFPYGIVKQSRVKSMVAVSPLYGVYIPDNYHIGAIINSFFESAIRTSNYLAPLIQKGAKNTMNITTQHFLDNKILLPTSLEEQKKIADFLSLIDERIEVEEQLLKKYEEQKKYLLRHMFV